MEKELLKTKVLAALKNNGVYNDVTSSLRAEIFKVISKDYKAAKKAGKNFKNKSTLNLASVLVADFLITHGLKKSLGVFCPETDFDELDCDRISKELSNVLMQKNHDLLNSVSKEKGPASYLEQILELTANHEQQPPAPDERLKEDSSACMDSLLDTTRNVREFEESLENHKVSQELEYEEQKMREEIHEESQTILSQKISEEYGNFGLDQGEDDILSIEISNGSASLAQKSIGTSSQKTIATLKSQKHGAEVSNENTSQLNKAEDLEDSLHGLEEGSFKFSEEVTIQTLTESGSKDNYDEEDFE